MNKRWLLNSALLGVIAVLTLVAVWRPGIDKPVTLPALSSVKAAEVKMIAIALPSRPELRMQRDNSHWKMLHPLKGRTNPFVVNDVLRTLVSSNQQTLPAESMQNLHRYGLDHPKASLKLDELQILFGDTNPVNNLQYVQVQDRVAMIDTSYFWAVTKKPVDFLSKRLIEEGRDPVAISLPAYRLSLENGSWQASSKHKELSADDIKQQVDHWRYAQALSVKPYEVASVRDWVDISFAGEKKKLRIGILSYDPELILYRPDEKLQYHFPKDIGKRLLSLDK